MFSIFADGAWSTVSWWDFRTWAGPRRLNGRTYLGPVFHVNSATVARPAAMSALLEKLAADDLPTTIRWTNARWGETRWSDRADGAVS